MNLEDFVDEYRIFRNSNHHPDYNFTIVKLDRFFLEFNGPCFYLPFKINNSKIKIKLVGLI